MTKRKQRDAAVDAAWKRYDEAVAPARKRYEQIEE